MSALHRSSQAYRHRRLLLLHKHPGWTPMPLGRVYPTATNTQGSFRNTIRHDTRQTLPAPPRIVPVQFLERFDPRGSFSGSLCRWRFPEKAAASRQFHFTVSVRQEPVMANTHKSLRHHMHQEPSDKLDARQCQFVRLSAFCALRLRPRVG
jgi:hypothetical protein